MAGIRRLVEQGRREVTLSVVAHAAADQANSVLVFDTVRLGTYAP